MQDDMVSLNTALREESSKETKEDVIKGKMDETWETSREQELQ
jgi:hypothetical protein